MTTVLSKEDKIQMLMTDKCSIKAGHGLSLNVQEATIFTFKQN